MNLHENTRQKANLVTLSHFQNLVSSPGFRLLRKDRVDFILYFLYQIYRVEERFFISYDEMRLRLRREWEGHELEGEQFRDTEVYINDWVNIRILHKRMKWVDSHEEIVLEPGAELSKIFVWLEDLLQLEKREMVGTESRFFSIYNKLKELAEESESDPDIKVARLEEKKFAIEEEIKRIRSTGQVSTLTEERIKGQYLYAKKEAMELISDFKQIEANFSEIRSNIQKKYISSRVKGEILEYVLGEDMELMNSEQGKSFSTFWEFLSSERDQEEWNAILRKIYSIPEIIYIDKDHFFRKLRRILRDAGGQVNSMVSGMSEQLKRSLVEKTWKENQKSKALTQEIKKLFLEDRSTEEKEENEFWFYEELDGLQLIMEKPLWKGDTEKDSITILPSESGEDSNWENLLQVFRGLDTSQLEANIQSLLRYKPEVSLEEVLSRYPETISLEALVAYLFLATGENSHSIDEENQFHWKTETEDYWVPKAYYRVGE